jgi:type IV pilus assembly protein PilA
VSPIIGKQKWNHCRVESWVACQGRRGFTLIELLMVVVIIGILVAIVVPKFANGKERAMVAAMRGDLHNLMLSEEAFYTNGLNYYNGPVPDPSFSYNTSENVTITLSNVSNSGWGATATHSGTARTCAIFVGTGGPVGPATVEGEPTCTP